MNARPPASDGADYKEVRGLTRGLAVLQALNQQPGGRAPIGVLAAACGLHRTTIKRLLETLRAERLVDQDAASSQYALTFEVRRLAEGYGSADWIDRIALPAMIEALPALLWPSDIATPEAGWMVVRESTHRRSRLSQHRAMIGTRLPMPLTATGRAYLAWCADEEREATLALIAARPDESGALARDRRAMRRLLTATRQRGYAINEGEWAPQADFCAIALPVRGAGQIIAAVNLVFPRDAVKRSEIERRFVPRLAELAHTVGARYDVGGGVSVDRQGIA